MDYRILGVMHECVHQDMVELRQRLVLVETWTEFQRSIVGAEAIEQWCNRLRMCPRRGRSLRTLAIISDFPDSCIVTVVVHLIK